MPTKKNPNNKSKDISDNPEKINHIKDINNIFIKAGFAKVESVADVPFTFKGRPGDIDDVFVLENIIVLIEYTTNQDISTHLLKKKIIFDHILNNQPDFIEFFDGKFESFKATRNDKYDNYQCKISIIYASTNEVSQAHKDQLTNVRFLDYPMVKYFKSVTDAVKLSAKYEIFKFLNLGSEDIGTNFLSVSKSNNTFKGSVLPESYSNFDKGFKIVSFYIDPNSLLRNSYVLRKDSWRDDDGLYQRMISSTKISSIRKYLYTQKRVFINNIIVTLPSETKLVDNNQNTIDTDKLIKTEPVNIQIPEGFNIIGLIDGQHRVFAYHEGGDNDLEIKKLREKQNLLVTGIIYPQDISIVDKAKFEAKLFLEINSTQTNANSSLKQAIGLILNPFSAESIARAIVNSMNNNGPLSERFERSFFDKDKIKITSVVSYGLKPIVKLNGNDSFFSLWSNTNKGDLLVGTDKLLLKNYIDFCKSELNIFFNAIQSNIDRSRWTIDKKVKDRVLTITIINGFIACLRKNIEDGQTGNYNFYTEKFKNIGDFDFSTFKSSHWSILGGKIYERYFK